MDIVVIVEVGGAFIKKMPSHYSTSHINNTTNKMTNTTYIFKTWETNNVHSKFEGLVTLTG